MTDTWRSYGHLCWAYDDHPAGFATRAEEFLRAGLVAGEQVWYVVSGPPEPVRNRLLGLDGFKEAMRSGAAEVRPLSGAYTDVTAIDPADQVAMFQAATRKALATGYTGLRVAATCTDLVRTPGQRDVFARYEHQVDRMMRTEAFQAMCGYHRPELGERAIAELACLHPEHNVDDLLFQLYAAPPQEGQAALAGELDPSTHDLLRTTLDRADLRPVGGELVLDASRLRFADHRTLLRLAEYARERATVLVLRAASPGLARLAALLELPTLRVEVIR